MSTTDTLDHIRRINENREGMEKYNEKLIERFERFLAEPTVDSVMKVYELKQTPFARSSYNSYRHIRNIHWIIDIVVKELNVGYAPLTDGIENYREAVDKYRKTIFMLRRSVFMDQETDDAYICEAAEYVLMHNISPIAIHDIIMEDICFGDGKDAISYWSGILRYAGRERDALLLRSMP